MEVLNPLNSLFHSKIFKRENVDFDGNDEVYLQTKKACSTVPSGIYIFDIENQQVQFANRQIAHMTGYRLAELKKMSLWVLLQKIHPEDRVLAFQYFKELQQETESSALEIEYRFKTKSGKWIWCLSRDRVLDRDKKGQPLSIIGSVIDITERKKTEANLWDQKMVLDKASIVAETDPMGRITYVNDKFCEISKYSRDDLIGKTHKVVNSGYHSQEFFKAMWHTIRSGDTWQGEIKNKTKDGDFYWVDTTIVPFFSLSGDITKYVSIRHDITREKILQQQLREQIIIAEKVVNASAAKSNFISEMSHEIRNSLNCIMGYAELFETDNLTDEQTQFLKQIRSSSQFVFDLMNDTLDSSQIEASKLHLSRSSINLPQTLQQIINMVSGNASHKNLDLILTIAPEVPETVVGDQYRLSQVLLNLLNNSVKFTESGKIELSVSLKNPEEGRTVLFSVKDTGKGVPPEKVPHLFKEFEQCHPGASRQGTGLGLSISKKIVELMGGEINVETTVNEGSNFYFEIPFDDFGE